MKPRILIIEDDTDWGSFLEKKLGESYSLILCETGRRGLAHLDHEEVSCIVLDLGLPDYSHDEKLTLLKELISRHPDTPVIILTAQEDTNLAVQATRDGAFDYYSKGNFDVDKFLTTLRNAVEKYQDKKRLRDQFESDIASYPLLGESPVMVKLRKKITQIAPSNGSVLVTGETGVGKENVARQIHFQSARSDKPFEIATIRGLDPNASHAELFGHPKGAFASSVYSRQGKFRSADKGHLLLDDVDLCDPHVQGMLLRVAQNGEVQPFNSDEIYIVDVRIIASTNSDLKKLCEEKRFREDLLYRLSTFVVDVPPLRERTEDIPLLAHYFLDKHSWDTNYRCRTFSEGALVALQGYSWPGNVRELSHVITSLLWEIETEIIDSDDVSTKLGLSCESLSSVDTLKASTLRFQREYISRKLIENDWNVLVTAQTIGISAQHLHRKINFFNLSRPQV